MYITNHAEKEARRIARRLLKKRLIACANIFPIQSLCLWAKKIAKEKEFVLIAKTTNSCFEGVKNEVEKEHSYSIPCTVRVPVSSNKKYFEWLESEVEK